MLGAIIGIRATGPGPENSAPFRLQDAALPGSDVHRVVQNTYGATARGESGVANISSDRLGYRCSPREPCPTLCLTATTPIDKQRPCDTPLSSLQGPEGLQPPQLGKL